MVEREAVVVARSRSSRTSKMKTRVERNSNHPPGAKDERDKGRLEVADMARVTSRLSDRVPRVLTSR